ncbi:MAG TPA: hypothetical protein VJM12_21285 [Pyrinomonadaceae bacterium]|nr:hypothetical protein [Pyrinomonadaceae bacterium]
MRNARAVGNQVAMVAIIAIWVAAFQCVVVAQRPSYPVGRRIEQMNRQVGQYERDEQYRDVEGKPNATADRKRNQTTVAQVKEDFERLQAIYNQLVTTLSSKKPLDDAFLSESLAGINKCSTRLKTNLALPQAKQEVHAKLSSNEEPQLQASLTLLLNHISRFVTNPMFESTGVLDVELSTKASRDLEEIIHQSSNIRKRTEKHKP